MLTNVYVDGFNLYYTAVKGTPNKWLNIADLCRRLLPQNNINHIYYYTARVKPRPNNPQIHNRQQIYLRALRTIPYLSIVYGRFLTHNISMRLDNPLPGQSPYVTVIKTEEKGSDVNLGAQMVYHGCTHQYDVAVVLSNDSDLAEPMRIVRYELGLTVGLLTPQLDKHLQSKQLIKFSKFRKTISQANLAASQFPGQLSDKTGTFHKPVNW